MIHFSEPIPAGRPSSAGVAMRRKVLIAGGAAGPEEAAAGVLQRFGFGLAQTVPDLGAALARMREENFDLVVVPLQDADGVELAALEREVRRGAAMFVIGTAAKADPELILRAMRSGIHEFLVYPPDPKDLSGAIDRLVRRGQTETARGTTLAVYSAKGGLGTTSVALNLAFALARRTPNGRVALADLVVSGGDVRVMLDLRSAYDVGDLLARMTRIDAELLTSILTPTAGGVWVLPASERPEVSELVDASAASTIVSQLAEHFAYTILDVEHHLTERALVVLDGADQVILVTQLGLVSLRSTQRTISLFQRLGYPDEKLSVVVNRYQSGDVIEHREAESLLGRPIFHMLPNDTRTSRDALGRSAPVVTHDPSSALARSYIALAGKLAAATGQPGAPAPAPAEDGGAPRGIGKLFRLGRK